MYGVDHPLVRAQLSTAAEALAQVAGQGAFMLGIGPACFYAGEETLSTPDELSNLAARLHGLDFAAVHLESSADTAALSAAVDAWAQATRKQRCDPAELAEQIAKESRDAVRCVPMDFERMQTTEEASLRDGQDGHAWSWPGLIERLLNPSAASGKGATPEAAAAWVSEQLSKDTDGGLRMLHAQIHSAAAGVVHGKAHQRGETMHRLNGFIEALTPELRDHLTAATPGQHAAPARDSDDARSTPQVLGALSALDGNLTQAARQSLMMCEKIASLAGQYPQTLEASAGPQANSDDMVATLEELLTLHDPEEHTPRDYLRRLEQISAGDIQKKETHWAKKNASHFQPGAIRQHAAQIAIHMAGTYTDQEGPCAEPMRYLARSVDELVRRGSAASVASAARVAESRLGRGGDDESLDAARRVLERITDCVAEPGVFDRLLADHTDAADLATLLRLSDPELLSSALQSLIEHGEDGHGETLAQALRGVGADTLGPMLQQLSQTHPEKLLTLLPRLKPLPFKSVSGWLGSRLTQGSDQERLAAFHALHEACPHWPADSAETLLKHPDDAVRSMTLHRLLEQDDAETLTLLGRFLSGKATGCVPPMSVFDRVTQGLLDQGDAGVEELGKVLRALGGVLHPKRSQLAARIAERLRRPDAGWLAEQTAKRWFRSPSALWARRRFNFKQGDAA